MTDTESIKTAYTPRCIAADRNSAKLLDPFDDLILRSHASYAERYDLNFAGIARSTASPTPSDMRTSHGFASVVRSDEPTAIVNIRPSPPPGRPAYIIATMKENSPVCARARALWTEVFTATPEASEATKTLNDLPTTIIADTSSISGMHLHIATGSAKRPIDTKKTAENIAFSGFVSRARRSLTSLDPPMIPTRNAPSASE